MGNWTLSWTAVRTQQPASFPPRFAEGVLCWYRTNPPVPDWKAAPSSTTSKSKLPSGGSVAQKGALEPDFFLGQGQGGSLSRWEMIRLNSAFWVCLKVIFGHRERLGALGLSVELWWLSCPAGNLLYCSNNATVDRTLKNHQEAVLANPLWRLCWPRRVIASRMPCQCSIHYAPVTSSGHSLISAHRMFTIQGGVYQEPVMPNLPHSPPGLWCHRVTLDSINSKSSQADPLQRNCLRWKDYTGKRVIL